MAYVIIRIETSLVTAEVSCSFHKFLLDRGSRLVLLYHKLMLLVDQDTCRRPRSACVVNAATTSMIELLQVFI